MSSPVCLLQSTDLGAPTLSGTVGALIGVLDACLVNGYGSVAVNSVTRSGSTVTVTTSAPHGFVLYGATGISGIVQISGANETAYNGKWRVNGVTSATVFTFDIGAATPASPATGSISSKHAPAGWTKDFTGTNKAVYRTPLGTNRFYLRVDDNSPPGGNALCASMRGYETMIDVDTGAQPFPTVVQQTNGLQIAKSDAVNASVRSWCVIADEAICYLMVQITSTANFYMGYTFGDVSNPYKPGDAYHTMISGGELSTNPNLSNFFDTVTSVSGVNPYNYFARSYNQLGSSIGLGKLGDIGQGGMGTSGMVYPAPHDNGLYFSIVRTVESSIIRGVLPGVYTPLHPTPLADGDFIDNIVGVAGRVFLARRRNSAYEGNGQVLFDITGPWH